FVPARRGISLTTHAPRVSACEGQSQLCPFAGSRSTWASQACSIAHGGRQDCSPVLPDGGAVSLLRHVGFPDVSSPSQIRNLQDGKLGFAGQGHVVALGSPFHAPTRIA